jgi:gas vesicle protein
MNMDYQDLQDYVDQRSGANRTNVWAGVLIGTGVGILAGLLLAPRAGRETLKKVAHTRDDLKHRFDKLVHNAEHISEDYSDKAREMADKAMNRI